MRDLIIIGAGDYAKEIYWLIERINQESPTWKVLGFVDANYETGIMIGELSVLGNDEFLYRRNTETDLVFAIANCNIKQKVAAYLQKNPRLFFPAIVDPSAIVAEDSTLAKGVVICAGTIIMPKVTVGEFTNINLSCTVGHDAVIGSCCTIYPGTNISGKVCIADRVEVGTGTKIIQGKSITSDTILGAGSVVVKDIEHQGTYVGVPARPNTK